jgi:hypothetical protein
MDSWFFLPFPRCVDPAIRGSGSGEEPSGENVLRLIQIRLTTPILEKITPTCQANSPQPESPIPVPETWLTFHPHAQQTAFRRRDVRQQQKLFARWNPLLQHSPNSNRLC